MLGKTVGWWGLTFQGGMFYKCGLMAYSVPDHPSRLSHAGAGVCAVCYCRYDVVDGVQLSVVNVEGLYFNKWEFIKDKTITVENYRID